MYPKPPSGDARGFLIMVDKIAVLIDGGHLRVAARKAGRDYNPAFIEAVARLCAGRDEQVLRFLYYDCAPFSGSLKLPVSGQMKTFEGSDGWLRDLAARDLFAVRRGVIKFRGWTPVKTPISPEHLEDEHFKPSFEQKGVDMRIGLDVAKFCETKAASRIVLMTGDTDCVPALKYARIAGLQTALAILPGHRPAPELTWHADYVRQVPWPAL
jgi:uncharacterized LabA/DUF88 family protein